MRIDAEKIAKKSYLQQDVSLCNSSAVLKELVSWEIICGDGPLSCLCPQPQEVKGKPMDKVMGIITVEIRSVVVFNYHIAIAIGRF